MSHGVMLVLATTFLLAAIAKLRDPVPFEQVLRALVGARAARALAFAVPIGELALGVALLAGVRPRAVALVALTALVTFSWVLVRLRAQPRIPTCNCFGSKGGDPTHGLVRNAALAAVAVALIIAPHAGAVWSQPLVEVVAAATLALGAACVWHVGLALSSAWRVAPR